MHPPHGPLKIGANRQITLPAELMRKLDLAPSDSVYVAMSDETEGALIVLPVERLVGWLDAGRRSDDGSRPDSLPLDGDGEGSERK